MNPERINHQALSQSTRVLSESQLGIAFGEYLLKRLLAAIQVDMVFDVGGNAGQYALQLRNRIGYLGAIQSFEPIPEAAEHMRRLASATPSSWVIRACAIGKSSGKAQFNIMTGDQFSSFLRPSPEFEGRFHGQHAVRRTIEVVVVTLDEAVQAAPEFKRGLLKLDTQGTELDIILSAVTALDVFPAIQMEVAFRQIYADAPGFHEVLGRLDDIGYALCGLFPNNEGHFPHLLEMDALFIRKELLGELP